MSDLLLSILSRIVFDQTSKKPLIQGLFCKRVFDLFVDAQLVSPAREDGIGVMLE